MKPEFVDNRNGNTLVIALQGHLGWLRATIICGEKTKAISYDTIKKRRGR